MSYSEKPGSKEDSPPTYDELNVLNTTSSDRSSIDVSHVNNNSLVLDSELEIRGESPYVRSLRKFGNPLAQDKMWSVKNEDRNMVKLPEIDFMLRLKQNFRKTSPKAESENFPSFGRNPIDNPSFDRNHIFSPIEVASRSRRSRFISDGFKQKYKGNVLTVHDISAADWYQFLEDILAAGNLGLPGHLVANSVPMAAHMGLPGLLVTKLIEGTIKKKKEPAVEQVVELWKTKFFNPRGVEVSIEKIECAAKYNTSSSYSERKDNRRLYKEERRRGKIEGMPEGGFKLVIMPVAMSKAF